MACVVTYTALPARLGKEPNLHVTYIFKYLASTGLVWPLFFIYFCRFFEASTAAPSVVVVTTDRSLV